MSVRVVYDTSVLWGWARSDHQTLRLFEQRSVDLCMSRDLLDEVRDVFSRPAFTNRLTPGSTARVETILIALRERTRWIEVPPRQFTLEDHPEDDHLWNLALAAGARYVVSEEKLHYDMDRLRPGAFQELKRLAPDLRVLKPGAFVEEVVRA